MWLVLMKTKRFGGKWANLLSWFMPNEEKNVQTSIKHDLHDTHFHFDQVFRSVLRVKNQTIEGMLIKYYYFINEVCCVIIAQNSHIIIRNQFWHMIWKPTGSLYIPLGPVKPAAWCRKPIHIDNKEQEIVKDEKERNDKIAFKTKFRKIPRTKQEKASS